jgi:uracil DNA glycosylase
MAAGVWVSYWEDRKRSDKWDRWMTKLTEWNLDNELKKAFEVVDKQIQQGTNFNPMNPISIFDEWPEYDNVKAIVIGMDPIPPSQGFASTGSFTGVGDPPVAVSNIIKALEKAFGSANRKDYNATILKKHGFLFLNLLFTSRKYEDFKKK